MPRVCDSCQTKLRPRDRRQNRPPATQQTRVELDRPGTAEERFWIKVAKQDTGCWLWLGCINNRGYGMFWDRGPIRAHRWSYVHLGHQEIPDDWTIDHLCGVKACVNPAHLEAVTRSENSRRAHRVDSQ